MLKYWIRKHSFWIILLMPWLPAEAQLHPDPLVSVPITSQTVQPRVSLPSVSSPSVTTRGFIDDKYVNLKTATDRNGNQVTTGLVGSEYVRVKTKKKD